MRVDCKAKFLRYLHQSRLDQGVTLIELLMVTLIMGIISAIALPSFLNQATRAQQAEAKQTVGTLNRAQQAYFLETGDFTSDISFLGIGIQLQTKNYTYDMTPDVLGTNLAVNTFGTSRKNPLKHYQGRVWADALAESDLAVTQAVICETVKVKAKQPTNQPFLVNRCGEGYRTIAH